jgi:hypothetical protein
MDLRVAHSNPKHLDLHCSPHSLLCHDLYHKREDKWQGQIDSVPCNCCSVCDNVSATVAVPRDKIQIFAVYSAQPTHTMSMKSVTTNVDVRPEMITSPPQAEWHYIQSIQLSIQVLICSFSGVKPSSLHLHYKPFTLWKILLITNLFPFMVISFADF